MPVLLLNNIKKRAFKIVSYFNLLYFIEIINLMFLLLIMFGKVISIITGLILALLLSLHIILLYFKKERNRKVQLYLMDIHLAYSIPFLVIFLLYSNDSRLIDYLFFLLRFVLCCFEILFIYVLSDYSENNDVIEAKAGVSS